MDTIGTTTFKVLGDFFFIFYLAPGIQSFAPTNYRGAQALNKEFFTSVPSLIQGTNPQSDSPKKQFAHSEFQT